MRKMKDSGIEWIGEIPQGWEVRKLKSFGEVKGRIGFKGYTVEDIVDENTPGRAIVLGGTNIMKDGYISYNKTTYLSEFKYFESPEIMLKGNEILITKVGAGTGENALYKFIDERVTINPNVMIFIPDQICNSIYVNYSLLSHYIKADIYLESNKSGAQPAINQSYVKNISILYPPLPEQQRIADFLGAKCSKIDDTIEKQKTVIEKLKEYKQSIIAEAVTKGLNPDAPMKDSGIEWIGEIPQGWETCRLKNYAKIMNGQDYKEVFCEDGEFPVMGSGGEFSRANTYLYNKESVLLGRKGTINKPIYVEYPFWTVDTMYYTQIYNSMCPKFFYYLTTTINFDFYQYGSAVPSMTQRDLNNVFFTHPSFKEQQAIADYLDKKTAQIDKAIEKKQILIEKLTEYKKSLIYEAVTGKIEV